MTTFSKSATRNDDQYFEYPEDMECSTQFYPNYDILNYPSEYNIKSEGGRNLCNKKFSKNSKFAPGLFHIGCCCQRNVTLGFEIMLQPESSHNLARLLLCRDMDMDKLEGIVFDFGCNLHNYLLNREPRQIQFKRVLVDTFHYNNHKGCSSSYNAANYKKFLPSGFFTTGREQVNSKLSKIEESFRQMNYKNYFVMHKLFFALDNLKANGILK